MEGCKREVEILFDEKKENIIFKGVFDMHDVDDIAQILLERKYKIKYFGKEIDNPEFFDGA
jgi:hypothetical protein